MNNRRLAIAALAAGAALCLAGWASRPGFAQSNAPQLAEPAASEPSLLRRASLLKLAQPLWSDLSPAQQKILEPFGDQWNSLPLEEKKAWVSLANRYPRMSEATQTRTSSRISEWARLSPEQRRIARQNFRLARSEPHEDRLAKSQQYNTLTDEQKKVLQTSGRTSNTAAGHAGSRTALAKEASQPLAPDPALQPYGQRPGTASGLLPSNRP